jgi:hypothetical protein
VGNVKKLVSPSKSIGRHVDSTISDHVLIHYRVSNVDIPKMSSSRATTQAHIL